MALAAGQNNYHDCEDVDVEGRGKEAVLLAPGQECVMLAIPSDVLAYIFNCLPLRNRFLLSGVCVQMQRCEAITARLPCPPPQSSRSTDDFCF